MTGNLAVRRKRVGEAYSLVSTTVEVPKPFVKGGATMVEGKLLISAPGYMPGAFLFSPREYQCPSEGT